MTAQTQQTNDAPRPEVAPALRSPVLTGAVAAFWAGVVGVAVCVVALLLVWLLAAHGTSSSGDAVHAGVLTWLAADRGSIVLSTGVIDLVPLGLLAVPVLALYRCGSWAGRMAAEALPAAAAATVTMALTYGIGAGVIASASAQRGSAAEVGSVLVGSALLALVAGGCGVVHGADLWGDLWQVLPEPAVPVLRGAAAGLAVLVGGGALLLAGSMLGHFDRISSLARSIDVGPAGALGVLLLGLLSIPTAVVWAAAYAVGPGFAVGVGTSVAPSGVSLGAVPSLPLLGALPGSGHAAGVSLAALAVPPLAGAVIGWLAARRPAPGPGPVAGPTAGEALVSGVLAGVGLGLLAAVCSGSIGAARMSDLGPDAFRVAVAAAVEVGAVAALVAYEGCRHRDRLVALGARTVAARHWVNARVHRRRKRVVEP